MEEFIARASTPVQMAFRLPSPLKAALRAKAAAEGLNLTEAIEQAAIIEQITPNTTQPRRARMEVWLQPAVADKLREEADVQEVSIASIVAGAVAAWVE
jgi:hypothetical protein